METEFVGIIGAGGFGSERGFVVTLGTAVVLAILVLAVALALRSIVKGKATGCNCSSCSSCGCASSCHQADASCPAARKMIGDLEADLGSGQAPCGSCCEEKR